VAGGPGDHLVDCCLRGDVVRGCLSSADLGRQSDARQTLEAGGELVVEYGAEYAGADGATMVRKELGGAGDYASVCGPEGVLDDEWH